MNPIGKPVVLTANFKKLGLLGGIGLICFFIFQLLIPSLSNPSPESVMNAKVISKQEAVIHALDFARSELGYTESQPEEPVVTYQAETDLYGYLSREKLLQQYDRTWKKNYPYETFRVDLPESSAKSKLQIHVDLSTGKVVSFKRITSSTNYTQADISTDEQARNRLVRVAEDGMTLEAKEQAAAVWVKRFGFKPSDLKLATTEKEGGLKYTVDDKKIGASVLTLAFTFEDGDVRSFTQSFSAPSSYTDYIEKQTFWANWMTYAGYALFSFVLGVLAIVYASLTRRHTSFVRGIVLSVVYFIASIAGTMNMLPLLQAEAGGKGMLIFLMVFQIGVTFFMAVALYFSLVGGDGLMRQVGLNAWPRAKEPGYGLYVLRSMYVGYLWAFILLGVQSILFFILERTFNTFSTTDATQSPYNMAYPWLLPIMAWMAGIGEETVYRLFGIPMVKKIVKNTFVACLITTLIWALGHTLYPIYPVISRPIELTFLGLLFSFVFLRYGFIAAMFSHVIFDSILMGLSVMSLGDTVNVSAGLFWILLPAIVGYLIYWFSPKKPNRMMFEPIQKEEPYSTTPPPEGQL
ncbi:CPBP family intramembrane glutamic endopeptidase [Paenibacillus polymyxa]|uniref:CPBP family intramembrane glutamic endopeptidase n=1 Tax=Paenibacillus polymyxa TaxID=1406 RepID=UPI002024FE4B|nr:type II CAAX endopeptidase family protein [Paenibacillus polymyxa]URJ59449.3 type II CAAX endopeptidase family protein [Paenibacillus polymyxa]